MKEKFATRIENQRFERWIIADTRTGDFKGDVENTKCCETRRVGMDLVVRIQYINEHPKELNDRGEPI